MIRRSPGIHPVAMICWDLAEKVQPSPSAGGAKAGRLAAPPAHRAMTLLSSWLLLALVAAPLAAARQPPYPPSPIIREIIWAPAAEIIRAAKDGDNWPITWAADDLLYTAWGDGTGFAPKVREKLSCGFGRVHGQPPQFRGENLFSLNAQPGQGRAGVKSWGLLAVDDTLYAWFGHADKQGRRSRLAWSTNQAETWTFADWELPEFGLMGFINFGRAYAGARDEYVYAYSHDNPRADTPADRFVLMRAHRDRLSERGAWQFFAGLDGSGAARWSQQFADRAAVFTHPDACLRSAITYHPGLRRYLWWQALPQPRGHEDRGDTRYEGGFAIYDAPEPWGPWTTAYWTERWDVGPGEHGDFPAKWMDASGRSAWLVFSGDDAFSVRRAEFVLRGASPRHGQSPAD